MPYVPSKRKTRLSDESMDLSHSSQSLSGLQPIDTSSHLNPQQPRGNNDGATLNKIDDLTRPVLGPSCELESMKCSTGVNSSQLSSSEEYPLSSDVQTTDALAQDSDSRTNFYTLENQSLSDVGKSLSHYNHTSKDLYPNSIPCADTTVIRDYEDTTIKFNDSFNGKSDAKAHQYSTHSVTTPTKDENLPLSLSFLRKPARSGSMDIDVDRIMKQNTLLNSKILDSSNSPISCVDDIELPSSPVSPLLSETEAPNIHERRNSYTNPLVRKKSGELVKSSLKLNSTFETSGAISLPTTPTYKQVHFGPSIAVKYFDEKDKPISISADNSPYTSDCDILNESDTPSSDDDNDYAYYGLTSITNNSDYSNFLRKKLYDAAKNLVENETLPHLEKFKFEMQRWNLETGQFKTISYRDKLDCEFPVFLERYFINLEKTAVIGQIAVKNISYFKKVVVRYTIDDWVAVENIEAHYTSDIPRVLKKAGYDRFIFSIPTAQLIFKFYEANRFENNPEIKFCIQYTAGGHDYWDNNYTKNYTLLFFQETKAYLKEVKVPAPIAATENVARSSEDSNCYFSKPPQTTAKAIGPDPNYSPSPKGLKLKRSRSFDNKKANATVTLPDLTSTNNPSIFEADSLVENKSFPFDGNNLQKVHVTNIACNSDDCLEKNSNNTFNVRELGNNLEQPAARNKIENAKINDNEIYPQSTKLNLTLNQISARNTSESTQNTDGDETASGTDMNENGEKQAYNTLVEKYCFYNGPSTVSSFGNENEENCNYFYDSKFY